MELHSICITYNFVMNKSCPKNCALVRPKTAGHCVLTCRTYFKILFTGQYMPAPYSDDLKWRVICLVEFLYISIEETRL